MFGGRLGEIEAYIPPPASESGGRPASTGELAWMKNDLDRSLRPGQSRQQIGAGQLHRLRLHQLPLDEGQHVHQARNRGRHEGHGAGRSLHRRHRRRFRPNQKLEEDEFKTVAIPFYVLYDPNQKVVATFPGLTRERHRNISHFSTRARTAAAERLRPTPASRPPFKTLDGATLSTADWKGKVVVLNYWATWCVPCRYEIPEFNKMHQDLASKGVEVVGISMDEDGADTVKEFLKQNPMKYTVGLGTGEVDTAAANHRGAG